MKYFCVLFKLCTQNIQYQKSGKFYSRCIENFRTKIPLSHCSSYFIVPLLFLTLPSYPRAYCLRTEIARRPQNWVDCSAGEVEELALGKQEHGQCLVLAMACNSGNRMLLTSKAWQHFSLGHLNIFSIMPQVLLNIFSVQNTPICNSKIQINPFPWKGLGNYKEFH